MITAVGEDGAYIAEEVPVCTRGCGVNHDEVYMSRKKRHLAGMSAEDGPTTMCKGERGEARHAHSHGAQCRVCVLFPPILSKPHHYQRGWSSNKGQVDYETKGTPFADLQAYLSASLVHEARTLSNGQQAAADAASSSVDGPWRRQEGVREISIVRILVCLEAVEASNARIKDGCGGFAKSCHLACNGAAKWQFMELHPWRCRG